MTSVNESAQAVNFDQGLTDTRAVWREAVAHVAERAKAALPDSQGRIEKAVALVLRGDVQLMGDGTARVNSATDPKRTYIVNGSCDCRDYEHAPDHLCQHRLAYMITRRAYKQAKQHLDATNHTPTAAQPPTVPSAHVVMIQGKPLVKYAGLLELAQARGLTSLTAAWTYNDDELSLAEATATFSDARTFTEAGDATPSNVGHKVQLHWRRIALTRSKSRCLRDALGVDLVAVEELGEEVES
jgi:hypothetical protein